MTMDNFCLFVSFGVPIFSLSFGDYFSFNSTLRRNNPLVLDSHFFLLLKMGAVYDFSQFDKRQAVFVRHTPDGKRVDFHADINGGVPRCHQSGGGYVAGFFTGSFHVFLLSLTKAWTHRNTGAHVLHQINDVGFDWIVCRLGKYRSVLKSCYQSKHINALFAISPVYDCDWLSLPDGKKRKYGLRFLRFWLMMNEEDWWHLNGVGVDRRLTGVFPKAL